MLDPRVIQQYKNSIRDAASPMPDISGKTILVGFWHNWPAQPGQGYQQGRFAEMALTDIPPQYNVVAVAFMKGSGIPTFRPYNVTDSEFRRQIGILNSQDRAVLISLGGADAHIELHSGQEEALAYKIIELVETYGFDGLDIDLEQQAIAAAENRTVIPAALRMVREHYAKEGKHFIISMAPEFPHLRITKDYVPYIKALEDLYDFIAPQYYNQGGDGVWVDHLNKFVTQENDALKEEFLYHLTDCLIHGTQDFTPIPANRLAIGLPSNVDAAGNGYVIDPQHVVNALTRLKNAGNPIRGLMTWSVNWDNGQNRSGTPYNWEFVTRYGFVSSGEDGGGERPSAPANLTSPAHSETGIDLRWDPSTGEYPIQFYSVYRDGRIIGRSQTTRYADEGLSPGSEYRYFVTATDSKGNVSPNSATLTTSTLPGAAPQWREDQWYDRGAIVAFAGSQYTCVQEHTSNQYWKPSLATMLWQKLARGR
ncbi:glycosyl hydrolase family 18 protein [Bordetella genomosp. 9]|uniref:chitinase n=1 Tax=Bordetella genomosp. 9 TaxID=1416803 RepID=A0A1W6YVJ8_9BORD|nr:glycosyl hydrolase family 18 protein [Bordetella genomosp. 9]ARP85096.1 chitinase [Bordetella genomosp. 9]